MRTAVRTDDDPEWIHQMRIGVRRLRACLSLARKGMRRPRIEPLRVELRWLAQPLGPARDLDVFATSTLPQVREAVAQAAMPRRSERADAARRADRGLAQGRPRHRASGRRLAAVREAGARPPHWPRRRRRRRSAAPTSTSCPRRARISRGLCSSAGIAAWLALERPRARGAGARHAARLAAKKLRYATDFFAVAFRRSARALSQGADRVAGRVGHVERRGGGRALAGDSAGRNRRARRRSAAGPRHAARRAAKRSPRWTRFAKTRPFWSPR
jgi:CHAD domain-containing protein